MAYGVKTTYRKWQKEHPNFMTPELVKYERKGNYIIELSEGEDFNHKPFYGVSIIKDKGNGEFETDHDSGLNQSFHSRAEAEAHFNTVKEKLK